MRQVFLSHITQDSFRPVLLSFLGNISEKHQFMALNQLVKTLCLCFNRVSNF